MGKEGSLPAVWPAASPELRSQPRIAALDAFFRSGRPWGEEPFNERGIDPDRLAPALHGLALGLTAVEGMCEEAAHPFGLEDVITAGVVALGLFGASWDEPTCERESRKHQGYRRGSGG